MNSEPLDENSETIRVFGVRTKKELAKHIKKMVDPYLAYGSNGENDLLNCCYTIKDRSNLSSCIQLPAIRLTPDQYNKCKIDEYEKRERVTTEKYKRWIGELKK